jgi:hypothetical protein
MGKVLKKLNINHMLIKALKNLYGSSRSKIKQNSLSMDFPGMLYILNTLQDLYI